MVGGESLEVTVERDDGERKVTIPVELEAAFGSSPEARSAFEKLSCSHQREHVNYVSEAKKSETRLRRAGRTVEWLLGEATYYWGAQGWGAWMRSACLGMAKTHNATTAWNPMSAATARGPYS